MKDSIDIKELMEMAKRKAARAANPLTLELGKKGMIEVELIAEILGLDTDEDRAPIKEAFQRNLPKRSD